MASNLSRPSLIQFLLHILACLSFLFSHIILGPIWITIYFWRHIARWTATCKKHFARVLLWQDNVLIDNYEQNHRGSFVLIFELKGHLSGAQVKTLFEKNVFPAQLSNGRKRFPELKQYQTSWLGFRFWKEDLNFSLEHHIDEIVLQDETPTEGWNSSEEIINNIICLPFPRKKSPWKLYLVQVQDGKGSFNTNFVFRANHTLCDGYALIKLLFETLAGSEVETPKSKTLLQNTSRWDCCSWVVTPFKVLQGIYNLQMPIWRNREFQRELKGNGTFRVRFSPQIQLSVVKQLAARFGVKVPTIIMTLVAEAFSNVCEGIKDNQRLYSTYAVPRPNHPGTLTNHVKMSAIEIPIGGRIDIRKKLKIINESFLTVTSNGIAEALDYIGFLAGSMPPCVTKAARGLNYAPLSISNFSFGVNSVSIAGKECVSVVAGITTYKNVQGVFAPAISYKDDIIFSFNADDSFLTEEEMSKLAKGVETALKTLQNIDEKEEDCLLAV